MTSPHPQPLVTLSIVSHGQGVIVEQLLNDLRFVDHARYEIVLTLNIPEDESFLPRHSSLPLRVLRNAEPRGFGSNHNAAFRASRGAFFAIVNPDIRMPELDLAPLINSLKLTDAGACAPRVLSPGGTPEDHARRFPTVLRLLRRVVLGRQTSDYPAIDATTEVDWVAGMFVVFPRQAFAQVGGFDERYFMYFEDADICRRLRRHRFPVIVEPKVKVIHDARRASRRDLRHLRWHLRSACRYLLGW